MIETISLVEAIKDTNVQNVLGITTCVRTRNAVVPADLDSIMQSGIYHVIEKEGEVISNGLLIVHAYGTFVLQEFHNYNLTYNRNRLYWHTLGWGAWKQI